MDRLSTVLLWVQTHPLVVTGTLVVSLLLAGIYAVVIFMAIARMDADYFMRSAWAGNSDCSDWDQPARISRETQARIGYREAAVDTQGD